MTEQQESQSHESWTAKTLRVGRTVQPYSQQFQTNYDNLNIRRETASSIISIASAHVANPQIQNRVHCNSQNPKDKTPDTRLRDVRVWNVDRLHSHT